MSSHPHEDGPEYLTPEYLGSDADSSPKRAHDGAVEQAQPVASGPDFSGPGYESAYDTSEPGPAADVYAGLDSEPAPPVTQAAPAAPPQPYQAPLTAPSPQPHRPEPAASPQPYQPPASDQFYQAPSAAPVVAPGQGYGYQADYGSAPQPYGYQGGYGAPPQPYGYQPGYGGYLPEHPQSGSILALGIVGIFFGICAPIAWVMGNRAKKDIDNGAPYRFGGSARTGQVLGIIFTILYGLWFLLVMLGILAAFSS